MDSKDHIKILSQSSHRGMDWLRQDIFRLIDLYRDRPCLWDNDHLDRRNKNVKDCCWNEITESLKIDRTEVERKMKSLCTQFFREYKRKLKFDSMPGKEHEFKSKWFAFEPLCFLSSRLKDRSFYQYCADEEPETAASGEDNMVEMMRISQMNGFNNSGNCYDYEQQQHYLNDQSSMLSNKRKISEVYEEGFENNLGNYDENMLNNHEENHNFDEDHFGRNSKDRLIIIDKNDDVQNGDSCGVFSNEENPRNKKLNFFKHKKNKMPKIKLKTSSSSSNAIHTPYPSVASSHANEHKDEYSIYGEYVACKIRNLPSLISRSRLQRDISEVIYKEEMRSFMEIGGDLSCNEKNDCFKEVDGIENGFQNDLEVRGMKLSANNHHSPTNHTSENKG